MDNLTLIIVGAIVLNIGGLIISRSMRKPAALAEGGVTVEAAQQAIARSKEERFAFIGRLLKGKGGSSLIERNIVTAGLLIKTSEFMMINLISLAVCLLIGLLHVSSMPAYAGF